MHSKSDKIEIMINYRANEVIEELFQSLISRYQIGLETSMKDSDWIKNERVTTNHINKKI